jgi:2-polyprenyl-3-methyl-5-hydroxy-6-metoxy-1,4-benzoquinol methylase
MQRTTRFEYLKCPNGHGRLTTYFDFLREKDFIRPLTDAQIAELRHNVQTVNCSNCGGAVDLSKGGTCAHCGSPLSMLDMKQAEAMVTQLREADRGKDTIDPALPLDLLRARREVDLAFAGFEKDESWFRDASATGLVGAGLKAVARWLGRDHVERLSILDLGAGDGWIGQTITAWAANRGWIWHVTNLDLNPSALGLRPHPSNVAASVCALPFRDNSFDAVIASQMAHHLSDAETVAHFREAWRVTGDALFLTDTHRNPAALLVIWAVLKRMRVTPEFLADGLQSVRRGWRVGEWRRLAAQAEIPNLRVWLAYGSRVMLQAGSH